MEATGPAAEPANLQQTQGAGDQARVQIVRKRRMDAIMARPESKELLHPKSKRLNGHLWITKAQEDGGPPMHPSVLYDYLSGKSFPQKRNELRLAKVIGLKGLPR
jgi:hypothetical protein